MKKFLLSIFCFMLTAVSINAQEVAYTLTPQKGSNNSYAGNCDIEIDGIKWNLTGNSTMIPWRMGGKSLTAVDRTLYSKTPMDYAVDKVVLSLGTMSGITVNSAKLLVADNADFTNATETSFTAKASTDVEIPVNAAAGSYYKFVFNVTVSGDSNKFIQISKAVFYKAAGSEVVTAKPIITPSSCTFEESLEVTISAEEGATIYYTVDGTEPTTESNEYAEALTIEETTTVKAIAVLNDITSSVATAEYTKLEAKTIAEVIEAGAGTAYTTGTVVATYNSGFLMSDETGSILVYQGKANIGDVVKVKGETSKYAGLLQFSAGSTVETTGTAEVTYPEVTVMDGTAMDEYLAAPYVKYVEYTGVLTISGNYYNVIIEGASKAQGSISYPATGLITVASGTKVKVTGYTIGVSSGKYVNTMALKVEEYFEVAAVTPSEAVESLSTITIEFTKDIVVDWGTSNEAGTGDTGTVAAKAATDGTGAGTGGTDAGTGSDTNSVSSIKVQDANGKNVTTIWTSYAVVDGKTITFNLESAITKSGEYTVVIPAGCIKSVDDEEYAGGTFTFIVDAAPVLTSKTTVNVDNTLSAITAEFDAEIEFAAESDVTVLNVYVQNTETVAATITVANNAAIEENVLTLTLDEAIAPEATTKYTVEIPAGWIVKKGTDKAFAGKKLTYTVKVPFVIKSITPASGSTVEVFENIVAEYNAAVDFYPSAMNFKLINIADNSEIALVAAKDGNTVTFTAEVEVPNGTYTLANLNNVVDKSTYFAPSVLPEYTITVNAPEVEYATAEAIAALQASINEADAILAEVGYKATSTSLFAINIKDNADAMLYSNAACTNTAWGDEFKSWTVLFDDNTETIFHSEYDNGTGLTSVDGLDHYLRVDLGEGNELAQFAFTFTTRSKNCEVNSPTTIVVEGCNEANGEYTELTTITDIPQVNSYKYESAIITSADNTAYRYIRFRVTATGKMQTDGGGKIFFFISEFGMSKVETSETPEVSDDYAADIEKYVALAAANNAAKAVIVEEKPLAEAVATAQTAIDAAIEAVKNIEPEVDEATVALIATAKELIALEGIGYPAAAPRAELQAAIDAAEATPTTAMGTALQAAINAYYAATDVVLPENGKVYTFKAVYGNNKFYIYNNNGTLAVAACGDEELPESAKFICEYDSEDDYMFQFKTADGAYYLAYPSLGGRDWMDGESATGLEAESAQVTKFNINKILGGNKVEAQNNELLGLVELDGYRGYDNNKKTDSYGPIVVKHSALTFDGADVPFYNSNFTSAFCIEESEVVVTPLTVVAVNPSEAVEILQEITIEFDAEIAVDSVNLRACTIDYGWNVIIGTTATVEGNILKLVSDTQIKDKGQYPLTIPADVVKRASDGVAYEGGKFSFEVKEKAVEPLKVVKVTPETEVEKLDVITIEFNKNVYVKNAMMATDVATIANADKSINVTITDIQYKDNVVTFNLGENAITTAGEYTLNIPSGIIASNDGDKYSGTHTFTVVAPAVPLTVVSQTPAADEEVEKLETITVTFSENIKVTGINATDDPFPIYSGSDKLPLAMASWYVNGAVLTLNLSIAITDAGTYRLPLPAEYFVGIESGAKMESDAVIYFTVNDTTGIEGVDAEGEQTIYDLTGRKIDTITKGGIYIVNGKKVLVK